MRDVVNLLTTLNVRCSAGPLGVSFSWYFDRGTLDREGRHQLPRRVRQRRRRPRSRLECRRAARGHPARSSTTARSALPKKRAGSEQKTTGATAARPSRWNGS